MKKLFVAVFIGFTLSGNAQSKKISKEEAIVLIKKINTEMSLPKNYSSDIDYFIFKNHSDTIPLEISKGFYKRNGLNEHSMLVGIETIQNDKVRLVVDTNAQSMVLNKPNAKTMLVVSELEGALSMCKSILLIKNKDYNMLQLFIDQNTGIGFTKIEISFYQKTHYIKNIIMYYNSAFIPQYEQIKAPKVLINYSNISTSRIANHEFKTDKYIYFKNNTYKLNTLYKDFNLFNQLITENN